MEFFDRQCANQESTFQNSNVPGRVYDVFR